MKGRGGVIQMMTKGEEDEYSSGKDMERTMRAEWGASCMFGWP